MDRFPYHTTPHHTPSHGQSGPNLSPYFLGHMINVLRQTQPALGEQIGVGALHAVRMTEVDVVRLLTGWSDVP